MRSVLEELQGRWTLVGNHSKTDSNADADGTCVPHPDAIAGIVIHSRANIPAIKSTQSPCCAVLWLGMNKDPTAWWSQGDMLVVIISSIELLCPSLGLMREPQRRLRVSSA